MKLDHDLQISKNQLEKLNKSQRNLISSREKEIESLDKIYDAKKADARYSGEDELLTIRDQNQADIAKQLIDKKERLSTIKTSFDEAKKKLDQERELLISNHNDKIQDVNVVFGDKYKKTIDDAGYKAEDLHSKTSQTLVSLEREADQRVMNSTFETKLRSDEKSFENSTKLATQERNHLQEQKSATKSYKRQSAEMMMEHEKKLIDQNYSQLNERKTIESIHENEIRVKDEQHKDLLIQEDKSFKEQYENMAKDHQSVLDRIKGKFNQQINSLLLKQSASKSMVQNKNDDDFYKVSTLEPEIVDLGKSYKLSIKVPEHEKENVRLSARDRKISLSLTRKFTQRAVAEDGSENKSSRNEMFSKSLVTADLMNSKDITQSYNEGVLSFNIAKL